MWPRRGSPSRSRNPLIRRAVCRMNAIWAAGLESRTDRAGSVCVAASGVKYVRGRAASSASMRRSAAAASSESSINAIGASPEASPPHQRHQLDEAHARVALDGDLLVQVLHLPVVDEDEEAVAG